MLYPLSKTQIGVLTSELSNSGDGEYTIPVLFSLEEDTNIPLLKKALEKAVDAHPMIKARFLFDDEGNPVFEDRSDEPALVTESVFSDKEALLHHIKETPDFQTSPLYRIEICRVPGKNYLFICFHHLISDGFSLAIFLNDIAAAYDGKEIEAEKISGFELNMQEYSERETRQYEDDKAYYYSAFSAASDCPTMPLPDKYGDAEEHFSQYTRVLNIDAGELASACEKLKTTEARIFTAAYGLTLSKFTCSDEVLFSTFFHGRNDRRTDRTFTMLVRTMPFYQNFKDVESVSDLLAQTAEQLKETRKHKLFSYSEVCEQLSLNIESYFIYHGNLHSPELSLNGKSIPSEDLVTNTPGLKFFCHLMIIDGRYVFKCEYPRNLFSEDFIKEFCESFEAIVSGLLRYEKLCEIEACSEKQLGKLDSFITSDYPEYESGETVVSMFRKAAKEYPDNTALVFKDKHYTYRQLDELTDFLSGHIAESVGKREKQGVVSILIPRNEYMAILPLAVQKAGCAFQPLDPSYPAERLNYMVNDSDASLVIADPSLADILTDYQGKMLLTSDIEDIIREGRRLPLPVPAKSEDTFILLYTSGSTGTPKGVILEHRNLVYYCHWYKDYYELAPGEKVACYASFGFDVHMSEIYGGLTSGLAVHIIPEEIRLDLMALNRYFEDNNIINTFITTSVGTQFALNIESSTLKYLPVAGEKLVSLDPPENYQLINGYGPTEATIIVTTKKVCEKEENIPIGTPMSDVKIYITDNNLHRLPVGAAGELIIAGPQVGRGYLNQPEKTDAVFIRNPFAEEKSDYMNRAYRTGDIVRWRQNGEIEFIGRRDSQIKIHGYRIELKEIESVIREFPGIEDVTVQVFEGQDGEKHIVAYVVSGGTVDAEILKQFIADKKPAYMVPAVVMQLEKIPLNVNGKVDKRNLPEPQYEASEDTVESDRSMTRLEEEIADVLESVLGHRNFGVETGFTNAGLTSISSIRFAIELERRFGISPNVKDLQNNGNILSVENFLVDSWRNSVCTAAEPEKIHTEKDSYPLTQTQLGIYLECMMDKQSDMYNMPMLLKMDSSIDEDKLEKSICAAADAHPFLKCRIEASSDGSAVMIPRNDYPVKVKHSSCHETEISEKYGKIADVITPESDALFDFEIIRTEASVVLRMNFHHIVMDGSSLTVLLKDIEKAYLGETPEKETYTSFELSADEKEAREGKAYTEAKAYYDSVFENVSVNSLPSQDITDLPVGTATHKQNFPKLDREAVQAFCEKNSVTPNALFSAAFGLLLGKVNGQEEAVFTAIYNGRTDPRTFGILGMLVKTYPIYMNLDGKCKTDEFVKTVRDSIKSLTANDIYSFAEASRAYGISSDIIFAYQGDGLNAESFAGKPASFLDIKLEGAKSPLNIDVLYGRDGYSVSFEYRSDMYAAESIHMMAEAYGEIVLGMMNAETLADIDPLGEEAAAFLEQVNDTSWDVEFRPACRLMEDSASKYPDRTAIITSEEKLTYSQLNINANKLAHGLIDSGVHPGDIVALMLPRSAKVYITRQGILKSGAAFLPIDPKYPDDRISYMLEDSGAKALITDSDILAERSPFLESLGCSVLDSDKLLENKNEANPNIDRKEDDLCYCIYTSGSTGKPKGVMLSQKNLVNFVDANPKNHEILGYTERAHVSLAQAAFTFDVSVMEEFIPLANGMTICMAGEEEIHNPVALAELMNKNGVDMMTCTPSFLANMIDLAVMREPLERVVSYDFGAEAFPPSLLVKVRAVNPNAYIMNGYGPTEATISCTMDVVTDERRITIGRPNGNVKAYIVDEKLHILPPRMCGELVICGDGVGIGYIGRDDLTREKFIELNGMRAYRTGDLAEISHDGLILFHGRTDNQVKLRGLRVELGEIENAINSYPGVLTSIVLVKGEETHQFLAAWYTASSEINPSDIQAEISKTLTHYMVPGALMQIPAMPLTANGKIDKTKLPEPDYTQPDRPYTAPANAVEKDFCELFADILGIERVGTEDNFFELGGTSLSASRIAMFALEKGYQVVYADVFKTPTPKGLAALVLGTQKDIPTNKPEITEYDYSKLDAVLATNIPENLNEIKLGDPGNVLITGATGFLAIHVLWQYLLTYKGIAYCLLRKGKSSSTEARLRKMLEYYFSDTFDQYFESGRIRCIEGDITNVESLRRLDEVEFDTLINCAALVKHFDAGDELDRINVQGVKNLVDCCIGRNKRLIQISTVSVAGETVNGVPEPGKLIHENELFFGQLLENDYIRTKFLAERAVLEGVTKGLDAKIMRVGNLMGRHNDGEFQINFRSNGFMRQLRGYKLLGAFPITLMNAPAEFSEISKTAEAILCLSATDSKFTVFHPCNNHLVTMADVIDIMQHSGMKIDIVPDEEFRRRLNEAAQNPDMAEDMGGLIAYMNNDSCENRRLIDASISYTTEALFRTDFKWPITSPEYLNQLIAALDGLGMF